VYPSNSSQYPPQPAFQSPAPYSHPSVYFQVNVLCMYIYAVNWHFCSDLEQELFLAVITLVVYVVTESWCGFTTQNIHQHGNLNGTFSAGSIFTWSGLMLWNIN
jgi:hypothetical protein